VRWSDQGMEDAAAEEPEALPSAVEAPAAHARLPHWGFVHFIPGTALR